MKLAYFPQTDKFGQFDPSWAANVKAYCADVGTYAGYWDAGVTWAPAFAYLDAYAIYTDPTRNDPIANQHAEWILKDAAGNNCYIPWGNPPLPQYAGDIGNPLYRRFMISAMIRGTIAGYAGIWLDDVNIDISRVCDANGNPVTPMDARTGQPMTPLAWKTYWLGYLQEARKATQAVDLQMVHNTVWYFGAGSHDPIIDATIQTADWINFQGGFAGDAGLTGGLGQWSVAAKIEQMQRVYRLGSRPNSQEYQYANAPYAIACFRMADPMTGPVGAIQFMDQLPPSWSDPNFQRLVFSDLGTPTAPAERIEGLWRRIYSAGAVYMVEPGSDSVQLGLDNPMTDAATGQPVTAIQLAAKQGAVLLA